MANKFDYQIMDINTRDICIDELGQRDVSRRKAQFNKIMREFDPKLVQLVSVALIDGKYYCFDGQMTMKVLKARNGGRDLSVRCRVYFGLTKMDAAELFVKQRGTSSQVTAADKIRVSGNYGDQESINFQRLTENNGIKISWNNCQARYTVTAVSTLFDEYKKFNDDWLYSMYIRVIRNAWNGDISSTRGEILKGVGLFMRTYKGEFKENTLTKKLARKAPVDLIRDAQVDRSSGARKYAVQILLAYNYGIAEKNKLPNKL